MWFFRTSRTSLFFGFVFDFFFCFWVVFCDLHFAFCSAYVYKLISPVSQASQTEDVLVAQLSLRLGERMRQKKRVKCVLKIVLYSKNLSISALSNLALRSSTHWRVISNNSSLHKNRTMHINWISHFFKITFVSTLNLILKSSRINIALLHDKILIKCHKIE